MSPPLLPSLPVKGTEKSATATATTTTTTTTSTATPSTSPSKTHGTVSKSSIKSKSSAFLPEAGKISVTVVHESSKSYGLRLAQLPSSNVNSSNGNSAAASATGSKKSSSDTVSITSSSSSIMSKGKTDKDPQNEAHKHKTETTATTNENEIVVIDLLPKNLKNGLLNGAPLREGDVLKTVNNRGASDFLVNGNLTGYLPSANFEDGECVTFVSERGHGADADAAPSGEHSKGNSSNSICDDDQFSLAIVRAFCRKPASMDQMTEEKRCLMIGLEFHRVYAEDDGEYDNHNDNDTKDPEEGESESSDNDDNDDDDDDDNTEP
uniref:Uncharacterized protein n=1 Tax=Pseudo-nitzschia australis TaxID=44445 RepID=A0A6U9Y1S5_9STRA